MFIWSNTILKILKIKTMYGGYMPVIDDLFKTTAYGLKILFAFKY